MKPLCEPRVRRPAPFLLIVVAGVCFIAGGGTAAQAQPDDQALTQPSAAPADEAAPDAASGADDDVPSVRDDVMRPYGRGFMGRWMPGDISDEEWDAAAAFMREKSPNRWQFFERMSEGSRHRGPVIRMMLARYRNLVNLQEDDAAMYDLRVQQLTLEDAIWGLVVELRTNQPDEARKQELQTQLRQKVGDSIDTWMKERQHRLARLEETLRQERQRLDADMKRRDAMVDNRLQRELERGSEFMAFPRMRGGGRGGRGE